MTHHLMLLDPPALELVEVWTGISRKPNKHTLHSRKLHEPLLLDHRQIPHKALGRLHHLVVDYPARRWLPREHDR